MLDTTTKNDAFQLKAHQFTLTALQLLNGNIKSFRKQLQQLAKLAPKFFNSAPLVIDLQLLPENTGIIDFPEYLQTLREYNIITVGIRGGNSEQNEQAKAAGLAILSVTKTENSETTALTTKTKEQRKQETKVKVKAKPKAENKALPGKIITRPVRSGQQVYAEGCDLIVIGAVSPGAELLADGSIHIYGPLRGRALAGIGGDENARIFCQNLEAELISIAGRYIANDASIQPNNKNAYQILLVEDKLQIQQL